MAISQDCMDVLLNLLDFYDDQYNKFVDTCHKEVFRALKEICNDYLKMQQVKVIPTGAYALKNNYQTIEPMEFLCVLPADRESALIKEREQKKAKKKKNSIKDIYSNILSGSSVTNMTAIDVAGTIMREMQKYISEGDKVYFKNNVVFIKFNMPNDVKISVIIYVAYDFYNNGLYEYARLGYKTQENTLNLISNLKRKNKETNGNFLHFCKLIKMLELELVVTNHTNRYLSKKMFFVENILYNVPNKFFKGSDFCEMFTRITNYIRQCDIENIYIADNTKKQMFSQNGYYANSYFHSFVKKINYLCKNSDKLVYDAINEMEKQQQQQEIPEDIEESDNTMQTQDVNVEEKNRKIKKINKDVN